MPSLQGCWRVQRKVYADLLTQRLALRGHCEVPSRPGSQPVAGRQGRGMFVRGRLLLRVFKSFLRGSCLCIRLLLTWSQEWEGAPGLEGGARLQASSRDSGTHPLARSLTCTGHWGLVEGGAVCACVCLSSDEMLHDLHKFILLVGAHVDTQTRLQGSPWSRAPFPGLHSTSSGRL